MCKNTIVEVQSNVCDVKTKSDDETVSVCKNTIVEVRSNIWISFGGITMYDSDREALINGKWLNDNHMNAVQHLLKTKFPNLNGLHNVLCTSLKNKQLQPLPKDSIQIIHINDNHWITVSTKVCGVDSSPITVYDSIKATLSKSVQKLLAN